MKALGLDIGTTTVSAAVIDSQTDELIEYKNIPNAADIKTKNAWEKLQNPDLIFQKAKAVADELLDRFPDIGCIGLTGQMHGILYINRNNEAISPLYTWQDRRGELLRDNEIRYSRYVSEVTGYKISSGYGFATHFYNIDNQLVPCGVRYIVTIADYIALKLTGAQAPILHVSQAAGLGGYDIRAGKIDEGALRKLEIDPAVIPEVRSDYIEIGTYLGRSVFCSIGDNQASFLGSVQNPEQSILVNIGTGSQVSVYTDELIESDGMELRPFLKNDYLLVGSSLCGGYAYSLLEQFYGNILKMAGFTYTGSLMPFMDEAAEKAYKEGGNHLLISTKFNGTREKPSARGSIQNIGIDNFTPEELCLGILRGIVEELWETYKAVLPLIKGERKILIGSGNSIKKSSLMSTLVSEVFGIPTIQLSRSEEASYGAALFALMGKASLKTTNKRSISSAIKRKQFGGLYENNR